MIKLASWNIRGLNNPLKQKEVRSFVSSQKLQLFGVLEAKVRDVNLASTVSRCFPAHWNCSNNLGSTLVASIFVAWDPQMLVVDIILVSAQMITAKVQVAASQRVFFLSIVYGSNNAVDRRTLWNELSVLKSICGDAAWVMMGDFNVVRKRSERLHGFDSNAVDDFNSCLDGLDMDDMPTNGFWFSWSNKRGGLGDNKSKLDRALVNPGWINEFPNSDAWLLAPGVSDHCSLLVSVLPVSQTKKPFKFFNFWMKHHSFKDLLVQSWNAPVDGSSSLLQFSLKLKRLKLVLKDLNKRCFSNLCSRVGQAREELCHLQSLCFSNPHDADLCAKEKELLRSFMELSLAEEDFKKQKSRVKWLSLGDHNTRFFHQKMASHRLRSKILSLVDARGVRIEDPAAIKDEILSYYEGLLGGPFTPSGNFSCELRAAISNKLSTDMQLSLVQVVSDIDVRNALFSIQGDKAPGPDGYNAKFFQANWDVVGKDLITAVQQFFRTGYMLREWNSTIISLIPKVNAPSSVRDFRPISCCNVVYKCVSKILAARIQPLLPSIINPSQSAFIKGRSIADNILLMQELVQSYHKNGGVPRCAIKLDLMKAYDSVSLDFLFDVMDAMGFPPQFVQWISQCVSTPMYSVVINGGLEGYFSGQRGLRQGDPISPYLFLLVMEAFSAILGYRIANGGFTFHPKCQRLNISHVIFADDLFLLCGADPQSFMLIRDMLKDFHLYSGLQPNLMKSSVFFAGVSSEVKVQLQGILSISEGSLPVQYLGVPLISAKLHAADCHLLVSKITNRVLSWSNKLLSFGGRAQLINSVLFNIQSYWSSIFVLPSKVLKEVEKILRSFFWTGSDMKSTGAKVSWASVCLPKAEGGLGFRGLKDWNKAAMARYIWALANKADSLWIKWVHMYVIKGHSFWSIKKPAHASWTIQKLFLLRPLVQPWIKYSVGNGANTFFWWDNWHPLGPLVQRYGEQLGYTLRRASNMKVAAVIECNGWTWDRSRSAVLRDILGQTPGNFLPNVGIEDSIKWLLSSDGVYSVSSTWNAIRSSAPVVDWHKVIWFKHHVPRWAIFQWLCRLGRLATKDRLYSWGVVGSSTCVLCANDSETHGHLFFSCPFTSIVWHKLLVQNGISRLGMSLPDEFTWISEHRGGSSLRHLLFKLSCAAAIYHLWKERNRRIFQGLPQQVLSFMAGTIVEVAGFLGTTAGALQAFLQAKEVFLDPLKVRPLVNVEEIRDALNEAIRVLGSIRMDFEDEVEKSKTRVPSRIYMEWLHRVMEIEGQVRDVIAQSNEKKWFWFISGRQDFREDMKKMHEKVIQLCQESKEIRDKMLVDRAPERVVKRKGPDISKYEALRKPLEEILECLKRPKVKVIGIHGTVGIGKTTIMLNLNNHDRVAQMFDIVIWLPVSKEGSKENLGREHLQLSIAQRLKLTIAGTSNADDVALRIATELKRKKYLLLLDDVKTYPDFDEIGIPLSNNGSKVVLTTRLSHVYRNKMVNKVIKVAYLLEHEAWAMFRDVLGREELIKDVKIGPVAWQVCRECRGVPLLIEKVANTFRLKHDESLWSDGLNSWRMWPSQECKGMREMYELLRFCYNDLGDDRYKICFLYGALYPEDSDINKDSLLECWGAEDLLGYRNDARKVRVMTGDLILTHLMNVSLLEEGKSDYHVTMDKFIRQVALYILEENPECDHLVETNKELSKPPDEETWRKKRRISLGDNKLDELPQSPNCSTLSTLFLQKNLGLTTIPPAFFKRMRKLRVLDFSHTGITSLPSSLSVLTILKVLHLNNCEQLVELPSHIMKLVQLESLDIHGSGITYIPPHIEKLIFLKRLWVSLGNENDTTDVSFNYDMISKLSGLEELVIEVISPQQWNEVVEHIMKEVAKLQKFKRLKVCISNRIIDVIEVAPMTVRIRVPEARILLSYIRRTWWKEVRRIGAFRIFIGCENSEYNQNPEFVRYEKYFKYCNGADSKTPILEVLKEAEAFELVNHKDIKQLSDFGTADMDRIRGCLIEGCDAIEAIMDTVGSELLPNLEQLFMKDLPMLKSIWKEGPLQPGSLCKLTTVVISSCRTLVKIFPPGAIQQLHEIQYLTIEKCDEVEEIIPKADAGVVLPKLKELTLLGMKKLRSICANGSLEWPSLEKLKIFECRGLRKLPFKKGNVANLRRIEVEGKWWGALQNQEDKKELEKLCNFGMTQRCSSMKKRRS